MMTEGTPQPDYQPPRDWVEWFLDWTGGHSEFSEDMVTVTRAALERALQEASGKDTP